MGRKKKNKRLEYTEVQLNIMPFIDIFSMLNTFLLSSAVFVSIGVLKVQIPFLSNAAPPPGEPERSLSVNIDIQKEKVELSTAYDKPPIEEQKWEYINNKDGLDELHAQLIKVRQANPETDKATVFADDDVTFEQLALVLDATKFLRPNDPPMPATKAEDGDPQEADKTFLYQKIVMGSVLL